MLALGDKIDIIRRKAQICEGVFMTMLNKGQKIGVKKGNAAFSAVLAPLTNRWGKFLHK
jgi:hypothetical protein